MTLNKAVGGEFHAGGGDAACVRIAKEEAAVLVAGNAS